MAFAKIQKLIVSVRDINVMLDSDLASLYGVQTKVLLQAVKRNLNRFPPDFMFQLTSQEYQNLRSQIVTSNWGGRRYNPYVFTEQGVAMLSSVLRSPEAVEVNIEIMRAFVKLRQLIDSREGFKKQIKKLEQKYDSRFKIVFEAIRDLMRLNEQKSSKKHRIGFAPWEET